jgi:hypothetical protein
MTCWFQAQKAHIMPDAPGNMQEISMDAGVMLTIEWPQGKPTLTEAAQALSVPEAVLDPSFGVVLVNPKTNRYSVLCQGPPCDAAQPPDQGKGGPFSNPGIGTFGPPEPEHR